MAEDAKGGFPRDGGDASTARGAEPASPRPVFVAPAMVAQTGASMVQGGRRMSGRVCLTWKGRGTCAFGDACRFLHPAPPSRASPEENASAVPPLGYVAHKAQQQLGADPSRSLLAEVLESGGLFRRVKDPSLCALLWSQSFTTGALYDNLPDGAFVNHFPNSVAVTHKHRLVLSLRATPGGDAVAPEAFLLPAEADAFAAADAATADDFFDAGATPRPRPIRWIVKRSVGGEGQGIAVCEDAAAVLAYVDGDVSLQKKKIPRVGVAPTSLPVTSKPERDATDSRIVCAVVGASHVVQRYVPRPLRVFGRKVDMRVYVLVTSWGDPKDPKDPKDKKEETRNDETVFFNGNGNVRDASRGASRARVRAYAYAEGLVRFAAAPYDVFDADVKKHLTNNALATSREHQRDDWSESGASSPVSREGPDAEAHFKRNWSFETFGAFLDEARGAGSFARTWTRVVATARVAVEAARPAVTRGLAALSSETETKTKLRRHFELLGLDVLVDEDLRVWLLEVNSAPSLVAGTRHRGRVSETHHALKGGLLADAMNLLDAGRAARGEGATTTEAEEAANELERARQGRFVSLYG